MQRPGRRDDVVDLLEEVLRGRLRAVFDEFCAAIPALLADLDHDRGASVDGREFVRTLLRWIERGSRRGEQASRYLLIWYVKTLAAEAAHDTADGRAVADLLRRHLRPTELGLVDRAIAGGWDSVERARSLKVLASRRRREFKAALTPEQTRRFAPYLCALMPPVFAADTPSDVDDGMGSEAGRPIAPVTPATWLTLATTMVAVLALPALAVLAWSVVRAREPAVAAMPAPVSTADGAASAPASAVTSDLASSRPAAVAAAATADLDASAALASTSFAWTRQASGTTSVLTAVAWSGALALAVGSDGAVLSSADGAIWRPSPQAVDHAYAAATAGAGRFVAVGTSASGTHLGRLISTSTDGVTWRSQGWPERTGLDAVAYGRGAFVAVGNLGAIVRSTDGERWHTISAPTGEHLDAVTVVDDRFVVLGHGGVVVTSADGLTWTLATHAAHRLRSQIVAGAAGYLAVGQRTITDDGPVDVGVAASSRDLVAWTEHTVAASSGLDSVVSVEGRYVAAGRDGVYSSSDGQVWTVEVAADVFPFAHDIVWTGTMLIAVGDGGAIFTGTPRPRRAPVLPGR